MLKHWNHYITEREGMSFSFQILKQNYAKHVFKIVSHCYDSLMKLTISINFKLT